MFPGECVVRCGLVLACIVSGALTTVTLKAMFETTVVLPDGSIATFSCSVFASLLQYLAMTLLVLLQALVQYGSSGMCPHSQDVGVPEAFSNYDTVCYMFGRCSLGLSACHVVVTLCTQTALMFVPATVHAALRQGNIPMITAIRIYILQKKCAQHQIIGAGILTLGLVVMGLASHTGNDHLHGAVHYGLGICLLCAASTLLAGRYVAEEILMQRDKIPPMVVVGAQGFLGSIASTLLLVVSHQMGYEDFWNTFGMLRASSQVQVLVVEFVTLTVVYNLVMAYTTKLFDATCKAMIRGTKPVSVWALQLLCFYALDSSSRMQHYGEPWTPPRSWFVLFATIIVASGLVLYFYTGNKQICKQMEEVKLDYGTLIKHSA